MLVYNLVSDALVWNCHPGGHPHSLYVGGQRTRHALVEQLLGVVHCGKADLGAFGLDLKSRVHSWLAVVTPSNLDCIRDFITVVVNVPQAARPYPLLAALIVESLGVRQPCGPTKLAHVLRSAHQGVLDHVFDLALPNECCARWVLD